MRLHYSPAARQDLLAIIDHGREAGYPDPVSFVRGLRDRVASLRDHPLQGRQGRVVGTREQVLSGTAYLMVYRIGADAIEVLRVLHGAQQWPSGDE